MRHPHEMIFEGYQNQLTYPNLPLISSGTLVARNGMIDAHKLLGNTIPWRAHYFIDEMNTVTLPIMLTSAIVLINTCANLSFLRQHQITTFHQQQAHRRSFHHCTSLQRCSRPSHHHRSALCQNELLRSHPKSSLRCMRKEGIGGKLRTNQ